MDEERLNRLTPRERDVYEVWKRHPDWSNAQIGYAVMYLPPHVVRRYKKNIREKLGEPDWPHEEP
jgi:DNA-binding CsgD family transcriptional regulator